MYGKSIEGNYKSTGVSVVAQGLNVAVQAFVSLLTTQYVVDRISVEAYGFVGLVNGFLNYATVVVIALSSMASRFISIKYFSNDYDEARDYFKSIGVSQLLLASVLLPVFMLVLIFLPSIVIVPLELLADVRMLWAAFFLSYCVDTAFSVFTVTPILHNKVYLTSSITIVSNVVRAIVILSLYWFFPARLWYLGVGQIVTVLIRSFYHIHITAQMNPDLIAKRAKFNIGQVWEVLSAGIWNSIMQAGKLITEGLDLLIVNLSLGAAPMGVLSISKMIPLFIQQLFGAVSVSFVPGLTKAHAQGDHEALQAQVDLSIAIVSFFACFPYTLLAVFGKNFYSLWTPTQDAELLWMLSLVGSAWMVVNGAVQVIFQLLTIVNKIRYNAILVLVTGFLGAALSVVAVHRSSNALLLVSAIGSILYIAKNLLFVIPYAARMTGLSAKRLYSSVVRAVAVVMFSAIPLHLLVAEASLNSWSKLLVYGVVVSIPLSFLQFVSLAGWRYAKSAFQTIISKGRPN